MKYTQQIGLAKHIKEAAPDHLCPVYLFISADAQERQEAVTALEKGVCGQVQVIDGEKVTPSDLGNELNAISFLTPRRLLRVKGIDSAATAVVDVVKKYCDSPASNTFLVLEASALQARSLLYKAVEKVGVVLDVKGVPAWEKERVLGQWVVEQLAMQQKQIVPQAVQILVARMGRSKVALAQELEKLLTYVADRPQITVADVRALTPMESADEVVWELGRAVQRGNGAEAVSMLREILHLPDMTTYSILPLLRKQLHTGYTICSILQQGGSPADVTTQFPYMRGRILTSNIQLANGYGASRFRKAMIAIQKADLKLKSVAVDPQLILEKLLLEVT